ncbi:MAG: tetratricopeptide repeat protein [Planctomycetota bacterium]
MRRILHHGFLGLWVVAAVFADGSTRSRAMAQDELPTEVREYDVLVRKAGGNELVGTILSENPLVVEFLYKGNKLTVKTEEIAKIIRRVTPTQAYQNRQKRGFDPARYESQLALGSFAAQYPETQPRAIEHLIAAVKLAPERDDPYPKLFELIDAVDLTSRSEAARDQELGAYLAVLRAGVERLDVPLRAARLFVAAGDRWGAIYMLRRVLDAPPSLRSQYGAVTREAEETLPRLLAADGQREEARRRVEDALANGSSASLLAMKAGWLLEDLANGDASAEPEFLACVQGLLDADRSADAYLLRGSYRLIQEDLQSSSADFAKAAQVGEFGAPLVLTYALQFARAGKFPVAANTLADVRKVDSLQDELLAVTAYLRENEGHPAEALSLLEQAVQRPAAPWQNWIQYLQTRERVGVAGSLADAAQPFLARFSDNPVAFAECALLIADEALASQDGARARRWLDYAGLVVPDDDAEFFLRVGWAHLADGGDPERARAALERARSLAPEVLDVRNALGFLEYREGRLEEADAEFKHVVQSFPAEAAAAAERPRVLEYALEARSAIEAALREEVWSDSFDRDDSDQPLNNWQPKETFGVDVRLRGGSAYLSGRQAFEDDGLTMLSRSVPAERLSRVRARLRIERGAAAVRVGLRLEDEQGRSGLVLFRDKDGVLKVSVNRGDNSEVIEPLPEGAPPAEPDRTQRELRRAVWGDDRLVHTLEIRFEASGNTASLYFDGERIARGFDVSFLGRRGDAILGVSGAASLEQNYELEVLEVEVFRRLPEGKVRRRF